jgi:2-polyprenyl-6-hydroxyphenyl methylase/3-demethylubiquinone-9 3-methyltransferase
LSLSGIPVYYHRCRSCGFIFTVAFDQFTPDDFAREIYNREYSLVDPDFADLRPRENAKMIVEMFGRDRSTLRVLDYGGGNGRTSEFLRAAGFSQVVTYDPFVPEHANRPEGSFDLIISFEVIEHSPQPTATFAEMNSLLEPGGMILFSTLVQPAEIERVGLNWWYAAPRNGHVSLHSTQSISRIVENLGFVFGSFNENLHVLFRRVPAFASHLIQVAA